MTRVVFGVLVATVLVSSVRQARGDSWTTLDESSVQAYGQAWFEAVKSRDPSKLSAYLQSAAEGEAAARELEGTQWADQLARLRALVQASGGWEALAQRNREGLQSRVLALGDTQHVQWWHSRRTVVLSGPLGGHQGPLQTRFVDVSVGTGDTKRVLRAPVTPTPDGPRIPLADIVAATFLEAGDVPGAAPAAPVFAVRIHARADAVRQQGLAPHEASDEEALAALAASVAKRIDVLQLKGVDVRGDAGVGLLVTGSDPAALLYLQAAFAARMPAELRIEVRPLEELTAHRATPDAEITPRLLPEAAPWQGAGDEFPATQAGFDAYVAREVERFKNARAVGQMYQPSDPRYDLVFESTVSPPSAAQAHLLEARKGKRVLTTDIFEDVHVSTDPTSYMPTVVYRVRADAQDAFTAWTGANVGLSMAAVIDGTWRRAYTIHAHLRDTVQVSMGGDRARALHEARVFAIELMGPLAPIPLMLRAVETR
ncbi:MAG: hypothetical protein AB7T63_00635 [Planctomycetota bacterium]